KGGKGGQSGQTSKPQQISSVYDLVDAQVTIPGQNGQQGTTFPSPLTKSSLENLLPTLLDKTTLNKNSEIPARININTAPPEVLQALWMALAQKLDPGDATSPPDTSNVNLGDPVYQTTAWLMTRAN